MSDYTPTTDEVQDAASEDGATAIEPEAFDRWLAEIRADAWDEGALWAAVETGAIRDENTEWLTPEDNPYRTPRPHYELFPGTQEALDALTIRKEGS